ncbi:MAG: sulfotransferase [Erythrobacter sp.]|nr:sulfotransferase [Erythrobacter sp.]NCQ65046.1 sulfotransferase [Alphaproteobacteria bacterium]
MNIENLRAVAARFRQALQQHDRTRLVDAARVLIEHSAPLGPQWPGVSEQLARWGELTLALNALDVWKTQEAPPYAAEYEQAMLLARNAHNRRAMALILSIPENIPAPEANAYLRGSTALTLGDPDTAEAQFRRVLRAVPESGRSWLGIAQMDRLTDQDEQAIRALVQNRSAQEQTDRAALEHVLALLAHRARDYATAFEHYRRSTAIRAETVRYDPQDNLASAKIASSWTAAAIARHAGDPQPPERQPIFLTGLARSGTTLVEQILSAHSGVDGGGELGLALQIEATVDGFAPQDFDRYRAAGGSMDDLRALYLRLVGERIAGSGRFVDKSLNQSRSIGPLSALFPDAPIVWMRRDPHDNAWSIYRSWLANNVVSGWSFDHIAHHMRIEDGLLDHWRAQLGDRLLVVSYTDLVEHPDEWVERITRHCGLEPEAGQMDFHKSDRAVSTASFLQVREPINRRGIGVSRPYREYMNDFDAAYGDPIAV